MGPAGSALSEPASGWENLFRLANSLASEGLTEQAVARWHEALAHPSWPVDVDGTTHPLADSLAQAIKALPAGALTPALRMLQGRLSFGLGDMERAVPGLHLALQANNDDPWTMAALGQALHHLGRDDKAAPLLLGSLKLRPHALTSYWLAQALLGLKQEASAAQALRKALALDPGLERASRALAALVPTPTPPSPSPAPPAPKPLPVPSTPAVDRVPEEIPSMVEAPEVEKVEKAAPTATVPAPVSSAALPPSPTQPTAPAVPPASRGPAAGPTPAQPAVPATSAPAAPSVSSGPAAGPLNPLPSASTPPAAVPSTPSGPAAGPTPAQPAVPATSAPVTPSAPIGPAEGPLNPLTPAPTLPAPAAEPTLREVAPVPSEVPPSPAAPHVPSPFVRQRLFELQFQAHRPTQQHLWERSLGEYLLASAATRTIKQPRELDEAGRAELCALYQQTARRFVEAGWLEQACTLLTTALMYEPQDQEALDTLEETIIEWVDYLETDDGYLEAVSLLEGQWERRPSDEVESRLLDLFSSWVSQLQRQGDPAGAQAVDAHASQRMRYWKAMKAEWSARVERPRIPDWHLDSGPG